MSIDLRLGRWQDALADVDAVDSVITDPPYSARTIKGQRSNRPKNGGWVGGPQSQITYDAVTRDHIVELVNHWTPRTKRWFVMFGDHFTVGCALDALAAQGWYHFAPVPWTKPDAAPRICSDGPSPGAEFIAIARPKRRMRKPELRHRKGYYEGSARSGRIKGLVGAKPLWLLERLVLDYSEPGDLIVDPFAGGGSTLRAAYRHGRFAIGAEMDPARFAIGTARCALDAAAVAEAV